MHSCMNMDVSLESHTQNVPHVGLPQSAPVNKAIELKIKPIGAIAAAR